MDESTLKFRYPHMNAKELMYFSSIAKLVEFNGHLQYCSGLYDDKELNAKLFETSKHVYDLINTTLSLYEKSEDPELDYYFEDDLRRL